MISYLKHDFHICSTVSEKWPHRLSFRRIVLGGLDSRNCIVFANWLSCRSAEVAGSKLNFISVVVLYLMKYHSTYRKQARLWRKSPDYANLLYFRSTGKFYLARTSNHSKSASARVYARQVSQLNLNSFEFGVCSDSFFNLQNCSCFQLELKSRDTSLCPSRFRNSIPVANDLVNSVRRPAASFWFHILLTGKEKH